MELYYDDNYDYASGKFTGMSDKTKQIFKDDLKIFYNVFTGKTDIPPEVTKFADIKLRDYHKMPMCQGPDAPFKSKHKGPLTNKLFNDYAENLKAMIDKANRNQNALLSIINQIFVYTIDPQTKKKQIRVTPNLSEARLQEIVVETRALIIKLYLTCEMDYVNSIKMYEAIVEKKIFETSQNQLKTFEQMKEKLSIGESVPEPAEVKQIQSVAQEKIAEKKEEAEEKVKEITEKKEEIVKQVVEEATTEVPKKTTPPVNTSIIA
jgi:flagellar hook-basal body complex protein FliE